MNLLKRNNNSEVSDFDNGEIFVQDYRKFQYEKIINYLLSLSISYISSKNNNYIELVDNGIVKKRRQTYNGIYQNELLEYTINVKSNYNNTNNEFLTFQIPNLIEDNFFIINGHHYVPMMYILDKPITIKKKSVKIYGLFSSMSMFLKENIVVFGGWKIPISFFMQILFKDDKYSQKLVGDYFQKYSIKMEHLSESNIIKNLNSKFHVQFSTEEFIDFMDNMIFDNYTRFLYQFCYKDIPNIHLRDIIINALQQDLSSKVNNFIDLNNKRLIFIEMLFRPYLDLIGNIAFKVSRGEHMSSATNFNKRTISNYFLNHLDGRHLYDCVNLYSSIISLKVSMLGPEVDSPPQAIKDIHPSHFGKLCPVSVSSKNVGETVTLTPTCKVDYYGCFL